MLTIRVPRNRSKVDNTNPFFDVKDVPILRSDTGLPTGDRYIVNAETDQILGQPIAKGYHITTHRQASDLVKGFLEEMNLPYEEKFAITNKRGNQFYQTLTFPELETNLASFGSSTAYDTKGSKNEMIQPSLIIRNSYNKSMRVSFEYGLFRMICQNGMVRPASKDSVTHIAFRHNSVLDKDIVKNSLLENMEKSAKLIQVAYNNLNQEGGLVYLNRILNAEALTDAFKHTLLTKFADRLDLDIGVKETKNPVRGKVVEWEISKVNTDESAWSIYNMTTQVSTHELTSQSERLKTDKVIANIFLAGNVA